MPAGIDRNFRKMALATFGNFGRLDRLLYIGQNGGDARHGRRARNKKDEAMKAKTDKAKEARKNLQSAEVMRTMRHVNGDDQHALYGLLSMLGGLEMLRFASEHTEAWGTEARGLADDLAPHMDGIEAVLKKYRDGILYVQPEAATA